MRAPSSPRTPATLDNRTAPGRVRLRLHAASYPLDNMLKTKTHLLLAFAVSLALPLSGCFEEITGPYDGPTRVEFAQFPGSATGYGRTSCEDDGTIEATVNLIGPQRSSDLTVNFSVDGESSSAQEGTQYSFPEGTQVTIPAGQSSATFPIQIIDDTDNDDDVVTLALELTSTSDASVEPAENFKRFTFTFQDDEDDPNIPPPPTGTDVACE